MEYTTYANNNEYEVLLSGKLLFDDMPLFRKIIADFLSSKKASWIVDLTKLDFIDSAGLGLLLCIKEAADKGKNKISLRLGTDDKINEIMEISKFNQLIPFIE